MSQSYKPAFRVEEIWQKIGFSFCLFLKFQLKVLSNKKMIYWKMTEFKEKQISRRTPNGIKHGDY